MTITIRERAYGGVFRIHPDGRVSAHVERIREAVDEHGNVQPGMAMELPPVEVDAAGPEFADLLENVNAAAVAGNARLHAELEAARSELDAVMREAAEANRKAELAIEAATAARRKAEAKEAAARQEADALRDRLASLGAEQS